MNRSAFKMKLKPGFEAEYKKAARRNLAGAFANFSKAGSSDISIIPDGETLSLFALWKRSSRKRYPFSSGAAVI
jgi:L-rhamnose mutarotase